MNGLVRVEALGEMVSGATTTLANKIWTAEHWLGAVCDTDLKTLHIQTICFECVV